MAESGPSVAERGLTERDLKPAQTGKLATPLSPEIQPRPREILNIRQTAKELGIDGPFDSKAYSEQAALERKKAADEYLQLRGSTVAEVTEQQKQGLSEDQIRALEVANRLRAFVREGSEFHHPILSSGNTEDVIANKQRLEDELLITEQILLENKGNRMTFRNPINTDGIFNAVQEASSNHLLPQVTQLIREGWQLGLDSKNAFAQWRPGSTEKLQEKVNEALQVQQRLTGDADFSTLVRLFKDSDRFMRVDNKRVHPFMSLEGTQMLKNIDQEDNLKVIETAANLAINASQDVTERQQTFSLIASQVNGEGKVLPSGHHLNLATFNPEEHFIDPNDRLFWSMFKNLTEYNNKRFSAQIDNQVTMDYLVLNHYRFDEVAQNGKVSEGLFQELAAAYEQNPYGVLNRTSVALLLNPDFRPDSLVDLSNLYQRLDWQPQEAICKGFKDWKNFYKDGVPQSPLFLALAKDGQTFTAQRLLTPDILSKLSPAEQIFWPTWNNLPRDMQKFIATNIDSLGGINERTANNLEPLVEIAKRIDSSQSKEIQRFRDQILAQLLDTRDPLQLYEQISGVFERNNLPDVGKIFKVFEVLHQPAQLEAKIKDKDPEADLSPVLVQASTRRKYDIIYRDLLKVHLQSANPSLYSYLNTLEQGQDVIQAAESRGLSTLTPSEQSQLTQFLDRMDALYENSSYGRRTDAPSTRGQDLETRMTSIKTNLGVKENQRIADRVAEMFLKPVGLSNLGEALELMESARQKAHYRNVDFARQALASEEQTIPANAGDLFKGTEALYLDNIFDGGVVASEYLGASADSNRTPFDTDTSMVLADDLGAGFEGAFGSSIARRNNYGEIALLIRDRGQFQLTKSDEPAQYDQAKYELFWSKVLGERHYGIRTGVPTTEIDGIVATPDLTDNPDNRVNLERVYFLIAQNGFYIPVTDSKGKLIFTPEDYETYRVNPQEVKSVTHQSDFEPVQLINTLKQSPYLANLYESSVGVHEGYTLEQHTGMVGTQFERYFSDQWSSSLVSKENFRMMLAVHDLGKPLAFQLTGDTAQQHEYTLKFVPKLLQGMGISQREADIMTGVINQDYIGEFMQDKLTAEQAAQGIRNKALELGVPTNEIFDLIRVYYMSDASSYTGDAGGQSSLDHLFVFDRQAESNKGQIRLSDDAQAKISQLTQLVT